MRAQIHATKLGKDVKQNLLTLQRSRGSLFLLPIRNSHQGFPATASPKRTSSTLQARFATELASQGRYRTRILPGGRCRHPRFWVRAIDRLLPPELCKNRRREERAIHDAEYYQRELLRLVLIAKTHSGINILAHLALRERRWDAFLWICSSLIASLGPGERLSIPKDGFTDISWPPEMSLSELCRAPFCLPQKKTKRSTEFLSLKQMSEPQILDPLQFTTPSNHAIVGRIWQSLGLILLESSRKDDEELRSMTSKVLLVVAHLHHAGFIPHQAHQFISNWDPLSLTQPPLINGFSQNIIRSLSDAMYTYQQVEDDETFDINTSNIDLGGSSRLGVEVWLEFILWCCVHGGWATHGLSIVQAMSTIPAPWKWSLKSDRQIIRDSSNTSFLIAERTIGSEVVAALVNALIVQCAESSGRATRQLDLYRQLSVTKKILDKGGMGLGSFTWSSSVVRLFEAPNLDVFAHPAITLRYILPLSNLSKKPQKALAAPFDSSLDPKTTPSIRNYMYQQSSVTIGLYHQIISAYVKAKNLGGALRSLASLQAFTDRNKIRSIDRFSSQLTSPKSNKSRPFKKQKRIQKSDPNTVEQRKEPMNNFRPPGCFPEVPVHLLAALLDLVTVSGAKEVGKWMIYSTDIDGPLIPQELYTDNVMAESLIRFATMCKDSDLVDNVTSSVSAVISEHTLVSLACSRIRQRRFDSAEETLGIIQKFKPTYWNTRAFANLAGALISQGSKDTAQDAKDFSEISRITSNLLQGKFGKMWQRGTRRFISTLDVASSCGLPTDDLFTTYWLVQNRQYRFSMHSGDFQVLLAGAMEAGGSIVGKRLWDKWCTVEITWPDRGPLDPESNEDHASSDELKKLSRTAVKELSTLRNIKESNRRVLSTESTARMIVHKAVTELQQKNGLKAQEALDVLTWAKKIFGNKFVNQIDQQAMHCVGLLGRST